MTIQEQTRAINTAIHELLIKKQREQAELTPDGIIVAQYQHEIDILETVKSSLREYAKLTRAN